MPKKAKVITDFTHHNNHEVYSIIKLIENTIRKFSSYFTGIPKSMDVLGAKTNHYDMIRTALKYEGREADAGDARKEVTDILKENGDWINNKAKGDVAMLKRSGYPL